MAKKFVSAKISIDLPSGKLAKIAGFKSLKNTHYFKIRYQGKSAYVPQDLFVSHKPEARTLLQKRGVIITSDADWKAIVVAIEEVGSFEKAPLIEAQGWTGGYFAEKGGKVFSPAGAPKGRAIFDRTQSDLAVKGNLPDWIQSIAMPLTGQNIPMLAVMAAFAPPFLKIAGEPQNIGFEFCGPPATGKTTCLALMASIAGNPAGIPNFNGTQAGFENMFPEYQDMPFPIDEANLVDSKNQQFLKDFAFRMANGTVKVTAFQPDRAQYRFIFATTANRPFHEALRDFDADTAGAALQRLIPLKIPSESELGVFNFVPVDFANSGALASHLREAMSNQYGTPMRQLLRYLVNAQAKGADRLKVRVLERIREFESAVGIADTKQGKSRASSAFGLLYAAGSFAKAKKILPAGWDCHQACLVGYRNYQAQLPEQTPLITRLLTISQRPETLDLRNCEIPKLSDAERDHHGAFLRQGVGGRVELLLTESMRLAHFRDWARLERTSEFADRNLRDVDHITKQRQVRRGRKKERFICFHLPPELV